MIIIGININFISAVILIMYVCICLGVTDKQIIKTINEGAHTMKALTKELSVGSQCGKCCQCTKKILNNELAKQADNEDKVA